jgi:hypothetical protein
MIMTYLKLAIATLTGAGIVTKAAIGAGVVGALWLSYGVWHHEIYSDGFKQGQASTLAAIAAEDDKMIAKASELRGVFTACRDRGGHWNQTTGRCS